MQKNKVKTMTKLGVYLGVSVVALTAVLSPLASSVGLVTPVEATAKKVVSLVTVTDLNLRAGASAQHKVLKIVPKSKTVKLIKTSGSWSNVTYGKTSGWVNSSYLKKAGASATTTAVVSPKVYAAPVSNVKGAKYVQGVLIANKQYRLPSNYSPGVNSTAQKAVNDMTAQARKEGVVLTTISSYRSYSYQAQLFKNYSYSHGVKEAERFSARPGTSEHQTGLAFDFGGTNRVHWLEESFGTTKEGKWLVSNAHKYGFVLRYHQNKEKITGYMYEPWHFRYVGSQMATKIKSSGLTMEEYFNIVKK